MVTFNSINHASSRVSTTPTNLLHVVRRAMERRSSEPDRSRGVRRLGLGAASVHLELGYDGLGRGQKYTSRDFPVRQDATTSHHLLWGPRRDEKPPLAKPSLLTRSRQLSSHQSGEDEFVTGTAAIAKDHIVFAESPMTPGVPIIYRPPEERITNPDRINLDRRHLTICPILEGEEQLRLLNLQHNSITKMQHLGHLHRLVFLDFYDNLLQEITGLDNLGSLRVLMLGRNRIRHICGLEKLQKLDVLDLHGNMIQEVENLGHLSNLRVLNLAGNEITMVNQLTGLSSLTELNLRRNRITHVYDADNLPSLQRLFLSHNLIQSISDIACLSSCTSLSELTLDGNPLANHQEHRMTVLSQLSRLVLLNQKAVSEEEHEEADRATREEENKVKQQNEKERLIEERDEAISAIKRSWELEHNPQSGSELRSWVPGYTEEEGSCVQLYGSPAMDSLTPKLFPSATHLVLHYMDFKPIQSYLNRLKDAFPSITSLELHCVNLSSLVELRLLAATFPQLTSFNISDAGNPITTHPLFRPFLLSLLPLTTINGVEPTSAEQLRAQQLFDPLMSLLTSQQSKTVTTPSTLEEPAMITSWCSRLSEDAISAHKKKTEFEELWPELLNELVSNALTELQNE